MRSFLCTVMHQLAIVLALSAVSVSAQSPPRPASETADAFIGTWTLNVSKSTFEGAPGPKSGMRTFDYERDGLILCTAYAVSTSGRSSFVHYLVTLDGKEYEEMTRSSANAKEPHVPTLVAAKKIDDRNIDLEFRRSGKTIIWHSWTISPDGRTFTVKRKGTSQGKPTYAVMVYEKES